MRCVRAQANTRSDAPHLFTYFIDGKFSVLSTSFIMTSYKPAQIFASIRTDNPNLTENKAPKATKKVEPLPASTISNEILVHATGELSLPPDRCKVNISLSSSKDQAQEVKNSVARRLDYIIQTLQNHQIKENDINVTKVLKRVDGLFHFDAEVIAQFSDFNKCQAVSNFLVEKLDDSVTVSLPDFYHSPQRLENTRRQTSLAAVRNAKQKAGEIAQLLNAKVGQPISIHEEYCNEWEGPSDSSEEPVTFLSVQQKLSHATIHVFVKLTAKFELRPKGKAKEKV